MGALHQGHLSLIDAARKDCDYVVVSIYVNALQFNPGEDFDAYPRDLNKDLAICETAGVDVVFTPTAADMFPTPPELIDTGRLGSVLCGASRAGHFDGVATVVARLFEIVGDCRAYFGEKDYQQLAIVGQLANNLADVDINVIGCAVVREPDGLAMSSRNAYLTDDERSQAPALHKALLAGKALIDSGETTRTAVEQAMAAKAQTEPLAQLEYAAAVPADDITATPDVLSGEVRLLIAARFGTARLIDNIGVTLPL